MAKNNEAKIRFSAETGDFNKKIQQSNDEMAKLRAEMKLNAEEMKDTGVTAEGLKKKKELLAKQLDETRAKTEAMSQKVEKAKEIFGENSAEVKKLEIQLINQVTAQVKLERAVGNSNNELIAQENAEKKAKTATERLTDTIDEQQRELSTLKGEFSDVVLAYGKNSREAKDLAKQISHLSGELQENKNKMSLAENAADQLDNSLEKVEDGAKDAGDSFSVLDGSMSVVIGNGFSQLIDKAGEAIATFANLSQETQEYREDIGKLETAWESAGKSTELATDVYKEFYSVLGEEDRSIEAVNHLAKFVETEEDMAKWTNICAGVWGTFGDSLPIEGLTEASNETAKVGKVTGVLADALNWAGVNEEKFQESLDKCNNEQERAELITETLNGLYEEAAGHYKENNKSIIDARKATSEYTDTMADLGEAMEPLNTEITELKTGFAKELAPVIKKDVIPAAKGFIDELKKKGTVTDFSKIIGNLAKTVLPPLAKVIGFAAEHFETLVTGIGTAVVAFKAFSAAMAVTTAITAAKSAVEGLAVGVGVATKAQTIWNAAMAANPIGAVVTAIGLLVGGIVLLSQTQEEAVEPVDVLTEEEKELAASADEAAQAFRDQQAATAETVNGIMSEMGHIQSLANELKTLADEKGRVKEKDEARAQFILNELNQALGTEYTMTDGVVQKYGELKKNIDAVIQSKTANALLEANNADYVAAIQAEGDALHTVQIKEKEYNAQLDATQAKRAELFAKRKELEEQLSSAVNQYEEARITQQIATLDREIVATGEALQEKKDAYDEALVNYGNYHNKVINYEEAQTAALAGNYDRAVELLKNKGGAYTEYADNVDQATRDAVDALYKEAIDAGLEAERTRTNFENGVEGYTKEMVKEAEQGYEDALNEWATAYDSAHTVGTDLGGGLKAGMEGTRSGLVAKAKSLVSGIIGAMRKEADSHSPSRKTIAFGEDLGEGGEIGLENKTGDMVKVAENQVGELLKVYSGASDVVKPFGSLSTKIGGGYAQDRIHSNASSVFDNSMQNGGLLSYVKAVEDLANRAIELHINGKRFATATASDTDKVNGNRMVLSKMGLALG